ncbi:hypothetical protein DPMN_101498 [Dreissena polymorpha]|uniref:Uncharacterized protein n=1 Tax=Dreissena polymorpha TaxID=45954 RepID=A0A9D4R9S2_DREPO|nr:hypothetical protein DPMN_101498 [Dreissena polymorpha]
MEVGEPMIPTTGKFVWKEDPNNKLGALEFISNNPNADRDRRRRKTNDANKRNDRGGSSVARNNAKGRGRLNQPKSAQAGIKPSESHTYVTLDDVKKIALGKLMDEKLYEDIDQFDGLYRNKEFDNFLRFLLTYFDCFFEKLQQEQKQKTSTYILV